MRFGKPGNQMKILWITWTDGKSTTSAMLHHVMKQAWVKVGLLSTVYIDLGNGLEHNETHMTSLDHMIFWENMKKAQDNGCTHMVVEVSSHALFQYRTRPLEFDGVGCTNISREHLDFHGTMEHYVRTKAELFSRAVPGALAVLPSDFSYTSEFVNNKISLHTFGHKNSSDIWVSWLEEKGQLSFDLHTNLGDARINTRIVGSFNAENMMLASELALWMWLELEDIKKGLTSFAWLPGRQELVLSEQGITAMIDFAVTPDALRTLYSATGKMWYANLIAVFGATGNRDQGKRPKMGAIAAELCDTVILTEDENYHEDGMKIMKEVAAWIPKGFTNLEMVQDRTIAIKRGLEIAEPGDIVIVTGMANFTTRSMNQGSIPWDEKGVIEVAMRELGMEVK